MCLPAAVSKSDWSCQCWTVCQQWACWGVCSFSLQPALTACMFLHRCQIVLNHQVPSERLFWFVVYQDGSCHKQSVIYCLNDFYCRTKVKLYGFTYT